MTIAMSEKVDAEPCDVLRGSEGPVYFLLDGQLYVVHEVLGRWIEAEAGGAAFPVSGRDGSRNAGAEAVPATGSTGRAVAASDPAGPAMVEHWLVTASAGRFGRPVVFRLQRRPAPPAKGPDTWTVRAERR
jgi:hypothetical protein